jgi:bifunctional ADP-heptose synthase (sugar kinase/adenylyltransferase)
MAEEEQDVMGLEPQKERDEEIKIRIGVSREQQLVIIDFQKQVTWVSFNQTDLLGFIQVLIDKAKILEEIEEGLTVGQGE